MDDLPLTTNEVLNITSYKARSTLWRKVRSGEFPAPIKLGKSLKTDRDWVGSRPLMADRGNGVARCLGLGIQNPVNIRIIVEGARVPVLVDAGVGTASDAAVAMELGCYGVLMDTAIAEAKDPIKMARAMKTTVEAGRHSYLAARMPTKNHADPSSPLGGLI